MFTGPNIVRDGLVLAFDSANVRSYPGVASTIYDMTGNGNHGTKVNSPTVVNNFTEGGQLNYTLVDWSGGHPSNEAGLDAVFNQGTPATGIHSTSLAWGSSGQSIRWGGNVSGYPSYHNKTVNYGWQVEGYIFMPETGTYSFQIDGDDATDFFIGDHKCAFWYGGHGFGSGGTGSSKFFRRGWYTFKARLEEQSGGDGIAVAWNKPSDSSLSTIPIEYCATSIPNANKNRRIDFDGTNDSISIPFDASTMDFSQAQTICMWLRPGTGSNSARRNPYNQAYGGSGTITHETSNSFNYFFGTHGGNSQPYVGRGSGFTVTSNELAFISVTRSQSLNLCRWYKNGEPGTFGSAGGFATTNNGSSPILIANGYTNEFVGEIHYVAVYNKYMTQEEIQQIYNATKGRFGL